MKNLLALSLLLPTAAFAHDDHGIGIMTMLQHLLSSPEHMWPFTLGIALVAWIVVKKRS